MPDRLLRTAVHDLTERRLAEAKFAALLEAAFDAIVAVGRDGTIQHVNTHAEVLFGYSRDELLGRRVEMLVPVHVGGAQPADGEGGRLWPGADWDAELAGVRKNGTAFPAEVSLAAIDVDGGLLVSIRDRTQRTQAEIVATSSDAIISKTLDGIITSWNPAAERLYGYAAADVVGMSIDLLVPRELREEERLLRLRAAEGWPSSEFETTRLRADGSRIEVSSTVSPITGARGGIVGLSAISHDLTERKHREAKRQADNDKVHQSQRLESLGRLAGGVAHDFNNLLTVILNYASFVADEVSDNDAVRADVEEIRTAADRAARLVRQLLISGRRETLRPEVLDLNEVVRDVRNLLSRSIGEDVELTVHLAEGLPSITADRGQMEQVLLNLALNARDAMVTGGRLVIETRDVRLDGEYVSTYPGTDPGRYVQLWVSDTGEGMSADVKARAFEPFFTTKPRGDGSGLGLATVYGIAAEAGGSVSLYSEGGIGTTVKMLIPAVETPPLVQLGAPDAGAPRGNGEMILVAEDEEAMRKVAVRILREHGYRVLEAATTDDAMTYALANRCDLLLTDVVMPHMSGPDLAEHVRRCQPGLPVLFMSGYSQGVLSPLTLDAGTALLEKPFKKESLLHCIRTVLLAASTSGRGRLRPTEMAEAVGI